LSSFPGRKRLASFLSSLPFPRVEGGGVLLPAVVSSNRRFPSPPRDEVVERPSPVWAGGPLFLFLNLREVIFPLSAFVREPALGPFFFPLPCSGAKFSFFFLALLDGGPFSPA